MARTPQDELQYFQMFGLTATAPERLNLSLQTAIEHMHQTLYAPSSDDLTAGEVDLLEEGGIDFNKVDAADDPMLDFATEFAAILSTSLSPTEVAERLGGISAVRVRQMIRDGALFAVLVHGRWNVPEFQLQDSGLVPNIGLINQAIPRSLDAVSVLRWYTTPDPELETPTGKSVSPLRWLKSGLDATTLRSIAQEL